MLAIKDVIAAGRIICAPDLSAVRYLAGMMGDFNKRAFCYVWDANRLYLLLKYDTMNLRSIRAGRPIYAILQA